MIPSSQLGRTDLRISRLGFGVSGPHGLPVVSEKQTRGLIAAAYAGGVRLFDTAPFYGDAQQRLGRALREIGTQDCALITKVGTARDGLRLIKNFGPDAVRDSVSRSLVDLHMQRIDILLLHGPPARPLEENLRAALDGLRKEGLIGHVGVCGRGAEIAALGEDPLVEIIQAPVWSRWPDWCAAKGLGFLGIEAMASAQSRRPWLPRSGADLWHLARRLRHGNPPGRAAHQHPDALLRAALAQNGVNAVVTTTTRLAHLRANLACANPEQRPSG